MKLEQAGQIQLDSSFSLNVSFANDGTRCVGKLTQTLRDKEFAGGKFTMSVELVGIFNCTGAVTDEVKRQVHGEVYDQLFPYMQSQCANLAAASGIPGLMLRRTFQLTPITLPSIKKGRPGNDRNPDVAKTYVIIMAIPLYQDLWNGKETLSETVALRCGEKKLTFWRLLPEYSPSRSWIALSGSWSWRPGYADHLKYSRGRHCFLCDRPHWCGCKLGRHQTQPNRSGRVFDTRSVKGRLGIGVGLCQGVSKPRTGPGGTFLTLPLACYLPDALGEKLHLNTWQEAAGPGCMPWVSLLQTPQDIFPEKERWEEPVAITYTGGTTGPAKGVMLSRRAFRASLEQYTQAETEYGRGGENLDLLPLFSAFGLCQCVHVPLCLGMGVILSPLFRPNQLGQALQQYHPTQVSGTTSYWQLLLQDAWAKQRIFPS